MTRKEILKKALFGTAGLLVFSLGVHLTIWANIGLAPFDCLGMGISYHTPLNYGLAMTSISVIIVLIDLAMGEKIGLGTIIDALLTGNFIDMFNNLNPLSHPDNIAVSIAALVLGLFIMAAGQCMHTSTGLGCGPRDSFVIGVGKRLRRLSIGTIEILQWCAALAIGWTLGGPVGIGTVISTFGAGAAMNIVCRAIKFEPRDIIHQSIFETVNTLTKGAIA